MKKELIIPVYLNQKNVFDLIAMMQNGLTTVTRINSINEEINNNTANVNSNFGLSSALSSIFKADISASIQSDDKNLSNIEKSEERYHTPASLLYILRNKMKEEKILINVDKEYLPKSGDIIEFSTSVRKNPFINIMEKAHGIMRMAVAFDTDNKKNKNKTIDQNKVVRDQIEEFLTFIDNSKTIDVVSDILVNNYNAVITLEKSFLNDENMNDLMDGNFKIIGKVVRVIFDSSESIDLQRKAPLGVIPPEMLEPMFNEFTTSVESSGIKLPKLELEINGPVLQILPIAIFS